MTHTSKTILKRMLPRPVYEKLKRYALYGVTDAMDALRARRDPLVPPKRMIFVGGAAFERIGDEYLWYFIEHGGLERGDAVLDLGCGIGRMARPLTAYLDRSARYEGIDIDRSGIEWCRANISPRFPNFHFQLADVYNKHYNPRGHQQASGYRLPFPDETFDFVFLTSVFTHMYPEDVAHYLEEIGRVSKVGGRSLITYFLLNEESAGLTREGKSHICFVRMTDSLYVRDRDVPEDATAFPEAWVRAAYGRVGLHIREPVRYGSWCGRRESLSFQDIVVAEKRPPSQELDPPAEAITRTS